MGEITNTQRGLIATAEQTANKGVADGYASLDGGGKVPSGQLPAVTASLPSGYGALDLSNDNLALDPTKFFQRITTGANANFTYVLTTGFTAGQVIFVWNSQFASLQITNGGGSPPAGYASVKTPTNANYSINLNDPFALMFDGTSWFFAPFLN